jgi:hypothetical protein
LDPDLCTIGADSVDECNFSEGKFLGGGELFDLSFSNSPLIDLTHRNAKRLKKELEIRLTASEFFAAKNQTLTLSVTPDFKRLMLSNGKPR